MKIIYEWEVPPGHPNFTGHDDVAEAYRVFEDDEYVSGIGVQARYKGVWVTNPWSTRPLVRQLVSELKAANLPEQIADTESLGWWKCADKKCGHHNLSDRQICFACKTPRSA